MRAIRGFIQGVLAGFWSTVFLFQDLRFKKTRPCWNGLAAT